VEGGKRTSIKNRKRVIETSTGKDRGGKTVPAAIRGGNGEEAVKKNCWIGGINGRSGRKRRRVIIKREEGHSISPYP